MKFFFVFFFICLKFTYSQNNDSIIDCGKVIKIPIILHLVPSKSHPYITQIITNKRIDEEIEELCNNFTGKNDISSLDPKFKELIGIPNIIFYLSDTILVQQEKKGIIRYTKPLNKNQLKLIKPEKNLNLLIGDWGSSSSVLEENTIPKSVKINYVSIMTENSQTITHEVGHYLGLWHVWGASNCRKIKYPWDIKTDYISDTPEQKNCTDLSRKKECTLLNNEQTPNYNNFMDYSSCRCFFTIEQAEVMRSKIIKYRRNLFENSI
ncbi:M43 family zinc metalloprotease [Mariniflexile litorale]|uniref:M43 family zinc metalloprotease n=1 Tax=Mariniflexile litorale TaxID=3045158 RepID=A0AAU7EJF7_9FLAO|nr:M43 family zinc metalloprotease [Mariniflexile sp. KMM 9835]MDQ8211177.1 M43 family zinc metalloprotease [Mariniflexile sp. KMM 9835]